MAERRSMANALTLTPEKVAFIQGETASPKAAAAERISDVRARRSEATPKAEENESGGSGIDVDQAPVERKPTKQRPTTTKSQSETPFIDQLLVPLTTRLQPMTANALRRAHLEQKLKHVRPATQQEIVETAVKDWLRRNRYLDD